MGAAGTPPATAQRPAAQTTPRASSVVVVFAPPSAHPISAQLPAPARPEEAFERGLARLSGVSVAILSATQGAYTRGQLLLDATQGARVAGSSYGHPLPPAMSLTTGSLDGQIDGFFAARRRAEDAPQLLRPGLLAQMIPGGGGYAGIAGDDGLDALLAADRGGHVASASLGSAPTLLARIAAVRSQRRLVVGDLPGGEEGYRDLLTLASGRSVGEVLLVIERVSAPKGHELLWLGAAGLPGASHPGTLSSQTTNQRGLVSAVDIAPTILTELGLAPLPADMRGYPIRVKPSSDGASLRSLMARLHVIGERRGTALRWLLGAWALLVGLSAPFARARPVAVRAGALGVLWMPAVSLVPAAIEPSAGVEYLTIAVGCLILGALSALLLPWPRAPLAPAIVTLIALTADALAGAQLLMRSLLGPDPELGARFYGIGNELKSGLAVLTLAAVAAALYPVADVSDRRRRAIATMACTGIVLAVIEGSARIGAGVGGVILVSAGFAVATVVLLPGALTRKRLLIVLGAPVVALAVLAGLDLATAHGSGHFTGSILHARSAGDLRDVIVRRYRAAWDELRNHAMPYLTALSLLGAGLGMAYRRRVLSPVSYDPVWQAAFAGGLTAGVIGALVEDSGPVLLVVATLALGCLLAYLWGWPASSAQEAGDHEYAPTLPAPQPTTSV